MRSVSLVSLVVHSALAWCFLAATTTIEAKKSSSSRRLPRWPTTVPSYLPPSSSLSSWSTGATDTATQVRGGGVSRSKKPSPSPPRAASGGGGGVPFDVESARAVLRSLVSTGENLWRTKIAPVARDPDTYIVQPIQDFLYNQTQAAQDRRQHVYETTTGCGVLSALAFFFRPARLFKLCLASWLCGEALAATGVFGDDTNNERLGEVRKRIKSAWFQIRDWLTESHRNPIQALRNIETWESKHQWAVGVGIGLVVSPALIPLGRVTAKAAIISYVLSEINHRFSITMMLSPSSKYCNADETSPCQEWIERLDAILEWWRRTVRAAMEDPVLTFESIRDGTPTTKFVLVDDDDEVSKFLKHITPTLKRGLITGAVVGLVIGV